MTCNHDLTGAGSEFQLHDPETGMGELKVICPECGQTHFFTAQIDNRG